MALGSYVCYGVIQDRKLVLDNQESFRVAMWRMKEGQRVSILVEPVKSRRSNPQNAYLHGVVLPLLSEHFGESPEEVKRDLMGEFWGWTLNPLSGKHVPIRVHTSEMSVEEFTRFLDWLVPWAMTEWNIAIPLPNEVLP